MLATEQRCHVGILVSFVLLTIGIGIDPRRDSLLGFLIIVAGLVVDWVSFLYCLGQLSVWD